jgi:hypothetical protein
MLYGEKERRRKEEEEERMQPVMPSPSQGCQTCKARRIKVGLRTELSRLMLNTPQCDKTKPVCQRCAKSRRVCLDSDTYKQLNFSIHLENRYASGISKRPRGPRSSLTTVRPRFDLQSQALTYYVNYHLYPHKDIPDISSCLPECILAWKASGRSCDMVELALNCLAFAIFSRIQHHTVAAAEASSRYHRLISILQARVTKLTVNNCYKQDIEACILTILIMGRYESAVYGVAQSAVLRSAESQSRNPFTLPLRWVHLDGAMAILKTWKGRNSTTPLLKSARNALMRTCILRNQALPEGMVDGSRFGERSLALDYDRIVVQIVQLRSDITKLRPKRNRSTYTAKLDEIDEAAKQLDDRLQKWSLQMPSKWMYQKHALEAPGYFPRKHFYSPEVYSYRTPAYTVPWNHYFASRMLIKNLRLKVLNTRHSLQPDYSNYRLQWSEYTEDMNRSASCIAASLPCCLAQIMVQDPVIPNEQASVTINSSGEIMPYLSAMAVWPVTIAASLEGVEAKMRQWFRSELACFGNIMGDALLESARTEQWGMI